MEGVLDVGGRWKAGFLVMAVMLSACSSSRVSAPDPVPTPQPGDAPASPDDARDDGDTAEPPDPRGGTGPAESCDDATFAAVDGTVAEQLAAFAEDDWERAYTLTSTEYRQRVSPDEFRTLVEEQLPALAGSTGHSSSDCLTDGARSSLQVTVTDRSSRTQTYLFLLELDDGEWRISGASASATPEPGGA